MNSNFTGPIRWRSAPPAESTPPKANWTLLPGLSRVTRWSGGSSGATTTAGTGGHNSWVLLQGNIVNLYQWKSRTVSLSQSASFSVTGDVEAAFAITPLQGFRVVGAITGSFITGGTITINGSFTQTGTITAAYAVSAVVGYRVDGEIIATFDRRAGQLADCISGSGEGSTGNPPNAVH